MQCNFMIFYVICLVHIKESENANINQIKIKNGEERWYWGYVENPNSKIQDTTTSSPTPASTFKTDEKNPCNREPSPMPDFKAPGRRLCEQKCYEYIWNIKHRQEVSKIENDCFEYNVKNGALGIIGVDRREALPGEFPHMGAIGWKAVEGTWIFKCGSSLISSKFALTAAHCSQTSDRDTAVLDVDPKIVRFGDKNIIDSHSNGLYPTDAKIKNIVIHPEYKSPRRYFDIALIEADVQFNNNVQPACLWNNVKISPNTKAIITGWGVIESASHTTSPELQVAEVNTIDSKTCDKLLRPHCNRLWCGVPDSQICAGNLSGSADTCQGDSGGPLQVKINLPSNAEGVMYYVIGVTSFGFGCGLKNTPGIYTRVSSFLDWIEGVVWK